MRPNGSEGATHTWRAPHSRRDSRNCCPHRARHCHWDQSPPSPPPIFPLCPLPSPLGGGTGGSGGGSSAASATGAARAPPTSANSAPWAVAAAARCAARLPAAAAAAASRRRWRRAAAESATAAAKSTAATRRMGKVGESREPRAAVAVTAAVTAAATPTAHLQVIRPPFTEPSAASRPPPPPAHPPANGRPLLLRLPPRGSTAPMLRTRPPFPQCSRGRPVTASAAPPQPPPPLPWTARPPHTGPLREDAPQWRRPCRQRWRTSPLPRHGRRCHPTTSHPPPPPCGRPPVRLATSARGHRVNRIPHRAAKCPVTAASVDARHDRWRTGVMDGCGARAGGGGGGRERECW